MVYCGRCGKSGHYISYCPENYNRDGKRISKNTESENISKKEDNSRKGQRWTTDEEDKLEEDLTRFIENKSRDFKRSENAIYARLIKLLDEMGE